MLIVFLENLPFLVSAVAIIQGIVLFVRGKFKRRFAKEHDIYYEGILVRVEGILSIMLGVFFALIFLDKVSGVVAIVVFVLIGMPFGVIGMIIQQNGVVISRNL